MKRRGVIYHFSWRKTSGEVLVAVTWGAKMAYHGAKILGTSLIVAGFAGFILTFQPIVTSEASYRFTQLSGEHSKDVKTAKEISDSLAVLAEEEEKKEQVRKMASDLGVPNSYYSIYIPKIDAKAEIVENVNPSDYGEYQQALKKGVAHAAGSVFPGMEGATYLFAHSSEAPWSQTQYNTVFYLLRELEPQNGEKMGDEIYVFFLDKLHKYRVTEKKVVGPNDISWLTTAREGKERLVLQTCWPPGTAVKRLIVVAEPILDLTI